MYSLLPAIVSVLFLGYGLYVVAEKGFTRVSTSFLALCIATFCWQATWAVLFQVRDPQLADILIRLGYLFILVLPTSLYQFLAEISGRGAERRWIWLSYGVATVLGLFDVATNLFVNGHYAYFWGYYPRAGMLHPVHVLQTIVVVNRGLYITFVQQQVAPQDQRLRLRLCIASVLIYFFAAVDYLCNYGVEFYPPGVVFVAISLGLIALAVTRYSLMSPVTLAATVAHEMRTPLASIRMQADVLAQLLPEVQRLCQLVNAHGLQEHSSTPPVAQQLALVSRGIAHQVDRSNVMINMMLASSRMECIDKSTFASHSIQACIAEAVATYPFARNERDLVRLELHEDFQFHGSDSLMVYVLFNLIKNSLYAIKAAGKGSITITATAKGGKQLLQFGDTGAGIPAQTLPRIFETFFTTKASSNAGIGLAFCRNVLVSFGGRMDCDSVEGQHTTFTMQFPAARAASAHPPVLAKVA